jgi:exodeoxyribonuclease VII small subunit
MAKTDKKDKADSLSFEQAIDQLNQIVSKIEQGQVPLQESLEQYEKGMKLIQYCRGILQDAEKRIEEISTQNDEKSADKSEKDSDKDEEDLF